MRKLFIVLAVAAFVVSFTIPAIAEVSFFGQVRMQTYMYSQDEDAGDDSDLNWDIDSGASRFGANFKAGDVSATVSMRPNTGSFFRHWYGKWNFGAASLVVGQTWTPTFNPIDESVIGGGLASFGGSGRKPQLAISPSIFSLARVGQVGRQLHVRLHSPRLRYAVLLS